MSPNQVTLRCWLLLAAAAVGVQVHSVLIRPEAVVALASHKERTPTSPLTGVHFFPFGGMKKTADWANKLAAGQFEVTADGGIRVE